ncbi:MAG: sugar nucleotide-binding protein [Candidatus Nanohaloarchaea archaeon]
MQTVLLLGDTGMIGSKLREVLEEDYEVIGVSRSSEDIQLDLEEELDGLPDADIVVNAAGAGELDGLEEEKSEWDQVNVEAVEKLGDRYDTRYVHFSSLSAMGLEGDYTREREPVLPYSRSKMESEQAVRENFDDYTIIRPALVFDRENPPGLLEKASSLGLLPYNRHTTLAIEREKLAHRVKDVLEDGPEVVKAAEEYSIKGLAEAAGLEGFPVYVPDAVILSAGLCGEALRKLGFRVPGIVRARSMVTDQYV